MTGKSAFEGFKAGAAAVITALCLLLTACEDKTKPTSIIVIPPEQSESAQGDTKETAEEQTVTPTETSNSFESISSEASSFEDTENPNTYETSLILEEPPTVTEDSNSSEQTAASVPATTPTTTTATTPATTTAATTSATTPVPQTTTTIISTMPPPTAASTEPPVTVTVPNILTPSSPGTSVFSDDCGTIDYSNVSKGYISAAYTGKSTKVKLRITLGDVTYDHDVPCDGKYYYYPLPLGSGDYKIQLFERVEGNNYSMPIDESLSVNISNPDSVYLYPNRYVSYNQNSKAVYEAARVCTGKTKTIDKISAIFTYITDNITYDSQLAATVQSGYVPDPDSTLAKKTGICFDYASLFAAMARSQGIPAKLVIGYASPDIYHAWNEVYTPEAGWVTPELYISGGYCLLDSTFYAGSRNKKEISEYISNSGNYSAVFYY